MTIKAIQKLTSNWLFYTKRFQWQHSTHTVATTLIFYILTHQSVLHFVCFCLHSVWQSMEFVIASPTSYEVWSDILWKFHCLLGVFWNLFRTVHLHRTRIFLVKWKEGARMSGEFCAELCALNMMWMVTIQVVGLKVVKSAETSICLYRAGDFLLARTCHHVPETCWSQALCTKKKLPLRKFTTCTHD